MQGFPDPYSGFAQGLTSGVQSGATIMQMVHQKAQAKLDNDMKRAAMNLEFGSKPYLPKEQRAKNINEAIKVFNFQSKGQVYREVTPEDLDTPKEKALVKLSKVMGDKTIPLSERSTLAKMILLEGGFSNEEAVGPLSILETEKREGLITGTPGTPGRQAPPPFPQEATGLTQYPLTGDIPGTPAVQGLRGLSQELPPLEQFRNEQLVREGKPIDLPKDEKETYSEHIYQTSSGEYRKGLYLGGKMVTDLGKATEKDIKYKAGEEDSDAEIKSRLKIKNLVYGGLGAKYDMLTQSWVYPPNFDYAKAQRQEAVYLKKAGLEPITGDLPEIKGDASKHMPLQDKGKSLDKATATAILKEAGGDKERARQIAKERGYQF